MKKEKLDNILIKKSDNNDLLSLIVNTLEKINKIMKKPDFDNKIGIDYTLTFNLDKDFYCNAFNKFMTPRNLDLYYKYDGFNNKQKILLDELYDLMDFEDRTYLLNSNSLYEFIKENKKEINFIEINKKYLRLGIMANIKNKTEIIRSKTFKKTNNLLSEKDNFIIQDTLYEKNISSFSDIFRFIKYKGIMDLFFYSKKDKFFINKKLNKSDYDFTVRLSNKYLAGNIAELYNTKKKESFADITFRFSSLYSKKIDDILEDIISFSIVINHKKFKVFNDYIIAYL